MSSNIQTISSDPSRKITKLSSLERSRTMYFYLFISPWLVVFFAVGIVPLLWGLYLSFTNFSGFNFHHLKVVGLDNYKHILSDNDAVYSYGRTLLLTAIVVPASTVISLLLALLLNQKVKNIGIFRTIFYLPSIVPVVSAVLIWRIILSNQNGLLNTILAAVHLPTVNWLDYNHAFLSLIIMLLWGSGGGVIIYLAGLKGIPTDIYEAAFIDGATPIRRFLRVTVPLMTPVIFFNFLLGIISSLQTLIQPILLTGNSLTSIPFRPNYLYLPHAFQQIFSNQRFGYGLALLWVLFLTILIFTVIIFTTSRYWVHYEVDQEGN